MLCPQTLLLLLLLAFFSLSLSTAAYSPPSLTPASTLLLPSDAVSLLSFKSKADRDNKLFYAINERFDYCQWQGVKCVQGRVVRFVLQSFGLRGVFPANTLNRLDQLRLLSLQNNSLSGPIPDLSGLFNLKSLFLDRNSFTGSFPPSVLSLHRLRTLDLSYNNLTGSIPVGLTALDRLNSLLLQVNRFNGTVPPLNQSSLQIFNVSGNNLTGAIPVTLTLRHFDTSSFMWNPNLCGEIINVACRSHSPFFGSSNASSTPAPLDQNGQSQNVVLPPPACSKKNNSRIGVVLGFAIGVLVLIAGILCFFALVRTRTRSQTETTQQTSMPMPTPKSSSNLAASATLESQAEQNNELPVQVKATKVEEMHRVQKSGNLVFCGGEAQLYTLEQLMRGSAELLGRGTIGTTYKAVLDNQLIMTVKRLDGNKTAVTSAEVFQKHMDAVGGLRHPNLVPIRAYFQAKGERLIIYDYQPNGSLFSLIHGSRSARAKPLHWTSCLKIAEDVGQGLAYIHQASRLIHGNLKSSNVLLGADFEACLTDYCLAFLADSSSSDDPDSASYKAPETRKSSRRATSKSDVYTFGVLLLELLTGKSPSQHPFLVPTEMPDWVRAMRELDDGGEDNQLGMLVEIAGVCRLASPEQRPEMWQVLKMIQEIKESVMIEDNASVG